MFLEVEGTHQEPDVPPGEVGRMNIVTNRLGVPAVVDPDTHELITLDQRWSGDLAAALLQAPDLFRRLTVMIRASIEGIAGLDSELSDEDWWMEFNNLLTINEFSGALFALSEARRRAMEIEALNE